MKFAAVRPYTNPEADACKLVEIGLTTKGSNTGPLQRPLPSAWQRTGTDQESRANFREMATERLKLYLFEDGG
jgi:hypothetical protein